MKNRLYLLPLLLALALPLQASNLRSFSLSEDEWARPRSGAVIPALDAVQAAVTYWHQSVKFLLLIRYPGGEQGEIWASELRDWIISLGVPSADILLMPGSQNADKVTLVVGNRAELTP